MKYIDTDKLITKIKQKIESIENCPFQLASFGEEKKSEGELIAYKDALSLITSLQQEQPKIDFEKELDRIWFDNKFGNRFDNSAVDFANVREICRHFYKLGINARKKE